MKSDSLAMRDAFFNSLYDLAKKQRQLILISADCGAPSLDKFKQDLPEQYFTVGFEAEDDLSGQMVSVLLEKVDETGAGGRLLAVRGQGWRISEKLKA